MIIRSEVAVLLMAAFAVVWARHHRETRDRSGYYREYKFIHKTRPRSGADDSRERNDREEHVRDEERRDNDEDRDEKKRVHKVKDYTVKIPIPIMVIPQPPALSSSSSAHSSKSSGRKKHRNSGSSYNSPASNYPSPAPVAYKAPVYKSYVPNFKRRVEETKRPTSSAKYKSSASGRKPALGTNYYDKSYERERDSKWHDSSDGHVVAAKRKKPSRGRHAKHWSPSTKDEETIGRVNSIQDILATAKKIQEW